MRKTGEVVPVSQALLGLQVLVCRGGRGLGVSERLEGVPLGSQKDFDIVRETILEPGEKGGLVPATASSEGTETGNVISHGPVLAESGQLMVNLVGQVFVTIDFLGSFHEGGVRLQDPFLVRDIAIDIGREVSGRSPFHGLQGVVDLVCVGCQGIRESEECGLELGLELIKGEFVVFALEFGRQRLRDGVAMETWGGALGQSF